MAELRIQPKKSSPSPWLLVALAVLLIGAAAYFFLRPDPADEPARPVPAATTPAPADTLPPASPAAQPTPVPIDTTAAATPPTAGSTRAMLLDLSPALTQLVDRADLRDDAVVREQRDNFTSATARLTDGDPQASLRPGLLAAANLLLAVQQKGYPNLEMEASSLVRQASQLSGRDNTPAEQTQNHEYLHQASTLLNTMSYPAADVL